MVNSFTWAERRRLHWQYAHHWSRFRRRRDLLLKTVVLGAAVGMVISCATRPVYTSRVVMDIGECCHGVPTAKFPCADCNAQAAPVSVLDNLASELEYLHEAMTNFMA